MLKHSPNCCHRGRCKNGMPELRIKKREERTRTMNVRKQEKNKRDDVTRGTFRESCRVSWKRGCIARCSAERSKRKISRRQTAISIILVKVDLSKCNYSSVGEMRSILYLCIRAMRAKGDEIDSAE